MLTATELIDWSDTNRNMGANSFLVIDGAQARDSHLLLARQQIPFASLFKNTREQDLIDVAPLLISLEDLSKVSVAWVISWALDIGQRSPCLCWISNNLHLQEMADHLRQFHIVGLSDRQAMMLRWYDTRVLPVWLECLNSEQTKQFLFGMNEVHYMNRFGEHLSLHCGSLETTLPTPCPYGSPLIHLSDEQYAMLVDGCEIDSLVHHLRRVIPDETRRLSSRLLFEFVSKYRQKAKDAKIDDIERQTQLLLLAAYTSGKAMEHPKTLELLRAPPRTLDEFFCSVQALPDEIWELGEPLWSYALAR